MLVRICSKRIYQNILYWRNRTFFCSGPGKKSEWDEYIIKIIVQDPPVTAIEVHIVE